MTPDPGARRAARRASGFACIRCACTIHEYCVLSEEGDRANPFLLCPACRDQLNGMSGALRPVITILRRRPIACQKGFDRRRLPFMRNGEIPDVVFPSGAVMRLTAMPILMAEKPVLAVLPPEENAGPAQLTVTLGRSDGTPVTLVELNAWSGYAANWRFERGAERYTFASLDGTSLLRLTFLSQGAIRVDELRCRFYDESLQIDESGARLNGAAIAIPNCADRLVGMRL